MKDKKPMKIKKLRKKTNYKFFQWIQQVLKFDINRCLDLSTFLLNQTIFELYFKIARSYLQKELIQGEYFDILEILEKVYGFYLMFNLEHTSKKRRSKRITDEKISFSQNDIELIKDFFLHNSIDKAEDLSVKKIKEIYEKIIILQKLRPDFPFDPKFKIISESDAFNHIFRKDLNRNEMNEEFFTFKKRENELLKKKNDIKESSKINKIIGFEESILGNYLFGSKKRINEILTRFMKYYYDKIPSKKQEIKRTLEFFKELLKITRGDFYYKIQYKDLVDKLTDNLPLRMVNSFLEKYSILKEFKRFPETYERFNAKSTIKKYYSEFLRKPLFIYSGFVRTGTFIIWRALIKYLESLEKQKEFYSKKGILFENWCYKQAKNYGLNPQKIILVNPNRVPTKNYKRMKKQISNFPIDPFELEADFPNEYKRFYFQEFDLVFKKRKTFYIFEIKGKRVPISEEPSILKWVFNFQKNKKILLNKISLLQYNIHNNLIKHSIFNGIEDFVYSFIVSEGILIVTREKSGKYTTHEMLTPEIYIEKLDKIQKST